MIADDPVPLRVDEAGAVRVGASRVLFDLVVARFNEGASPGEIVQTFPVLSLAEVFGACGYYVGHRAEVDAYLANRRAEADRARVRAEAPCPPGELVTKLKGLKPERHASAGG